MIELESDDLAQLAVEKLQEITINDQKPVVTYALRTSPHQFESRCNAGERRETMYSAKHQLEFNVPLSRSSQSS